MIYDYYATNKQPFFGVFSFVTICSSQFLTNQRVWYITKMEKKSAPKKSAMDAALFYLGIRDRSVGEMREYLQKKQYEADEIESVLRRLNELSLLDDSVFARRVLRSKTAMKPVSRKEMKAVLIRHKIGKEIVEDTLSEYDHETELAAARKLAEEVTRKVAKYPPEERWRRAAAKMAAKGYPYGVIREALAGMSGEDPEITDDAEQEYME